MPAERDPSVLPMSSSLPLAKLSVPAVWLTVPTEPVPDPTNSDCAPIGRSPWRFRVAFEEVTSPTVTAPPMAADRLPERVRVPAETLVTPA